MKPTLLLLTILSALFAADIGTRVSASVPVLCEAH